MTKTELMQIRYLDNEIEMWKEELEKCAYDLALQSPCLEDKGRRSGISDKTANLAVKISGIKDKIAAKLIEIQMERERLINFIDSVDNSLIRQILFMRYAHGLSWNMIAVKTGGYNSPDNLRIMTDNFIKVNNRREQT